MILVDGHGLQKRLGHFLGEVIVEDRTGPERLKPLTEELLRDQWLFYVLAPDLNLERVCFIRKGRKALIEFRGISARLNRFEDVFAPFLDVCEGLFESGKV